MTDLNAMKLKESILRQSKTDLKDVALLDVIGQLEAAQQRIAERELPSAELSRLREWVKCVEAERDKAISWHSSLLKKFDNLQAEIARRDKAAGEPVAWQYRYNDKTVIGEWKTVDDKSECNPHFLYEKRAVYTAAQPSALPPQKDSLSEPAGERWSFAMGYNQAIADAKALGCKAIKLPATFKPGLSDGLRPVMRLDKDGKWINRGSLRKALRDAGIEVQE